jgi:hypothetical protein
MKTYKQTVMPNHDVPAMPMPGMPKPMMPKPKPKQ